MNEEAQMCYRAQDWHEAESLFQQLRELSPQRALYGIYLERIAEFRQHPPGRDWDGVYTHKTK
jgi:adenylate cyclase